MNAEIVDVGLRALSGNSVGNGLADITRKLENSGINVTHQTAVAKSKEDIEFAVKTALLRSDILITVGGIEPESEYIVKQAICNLLNMKTVKNSAAKKLVDDYCGTFGDNVTIPSEFYNVIEGSVLLRNDFGLVFGTFLELKDKIIVSLPENEHEYVNMFSKYALPMILGHINNDTSAESVHIFGRTLKEVNDKLFYLKKTANLDLNLYEDNGIVTIRVSSTNDDRFVAAKACGSAVIRLKSIFGNDIFSVGDVSLVDAVVEKMKRSGTTVSTAESCTGGLLSELFTSVSGASEIIELGICAYSNRIKTETLGVSENIINTYGAVSKETAVHMAKGIRNVSGSTLGIGITGVAGPKKSEAKAVGNVYIAMSDGEYTWIRHLQLQQTSSRDYIRSYSALTALDMIRRYLAYKPELMPGYCVGDTYTLMNELPKGDNTTVKKFIANAEDGYQLNIYDDMYLTNVDMERRAQNVKPVYEPPLFEVNENNDFNYIVTDDFKNTKSNPFSAEAPVLSDSSDKYDIYNLSSDTGGTIETFDAVTGEKVEVPIIQDKNNRKKRFYKFLYTVLIVLISVSTVLMASFYVTATLQEKLITESADLFHSLEYTEAYRFFDSQNPNYIGWLQVENTLIDNPVYQDYLGDFYQKHNMNRKPTRYGSLHSNGDILIPIGASSSNLTIRGNAINSGYMFGKLSKYKNKTYYLKHPIINLYLEDGISRYLVFSVFVINKNPEDDGGNVFDYSRIAFSNEGEFAEWYSEILSRNYFKSDINATSQDSFLTLVTNSSDFKNSELVVVAKKILPNEEISALLNSVQINPNPKYPKNWSKAKMESQSKIDENSEIEESSEPTSSEEVSSEVSETSSSQNPTPKPQPTPEPEPEPEPEPQEPQIPEEPEEPTKPEEPPVEEPPAEEEVTE